LNLSGFAGSAEASEVNDATEGSLEESVAVPDICGVDRWLDDIVLLDMDRDFHQVDDNSDNN
jgi:hypothetical protein